MISELLLLYDPPKRPTSYTASLAGLIASGGAPYVATKFAVVGLSESVYVQLQREGLKPRVSVLCPGFVDTNIVFSDRNRPADFADASVPQTDPAANAIRERAAAELTKVGLSPRAVGEQVLATCATAGASAAPAS